jgi:putative protease
MSAQEPAHPSSSEISSPVAPELLAPAGDWDCARAAIENGADAIYFGLNSGFNARARANNFGFADLPELMRLLHRRGLRGYVTFNTLVFPSELPRAAEAIERIAEAEVDAVLVQDLGVARLVRAIAPQLEIHASTQMTMTSAEGIEVAEQLGITRVVLARELSISEIAKIHQATRMPLEVFVHGALCVAYSGQCLTSESLGGRSANRGQCAQACRLPYGLIVDGETKPMGDTQYLLSPQDLAGYPLIPELMRAGVCSLKIEGRLKTAEYVANMVSHYRAAIDQAIRSGEVHFSPRQVREMELSFSRGFSPGWLQGCDHKMLVPGDNSAKRGVRLGEIVNLTEKRVVVRLLAPVARGDGIAFQGNRLTGEDSGGRVFELFRRGQRTQVDEVDSGVVEIGLDHSFDLNRLYVGQTVWKTDDPHLNRRLRATYTGADPIRRTPVDIVVTARAGSPLQVVAQWTGGEPVCVRSEAALQVARKHAADASGLREQFDRLGGTPFQLRNFSACVEGGPMVPHSVTGQLRKELVQQLTALAEHRPPRTIDTNALSKLQAGIIAAGSPNVQSNELWVLCRTAEQLAATIEAGIKNVYVDYHDIRQYRNAVSTAREAGANIYLATLRIQKPGEIGLTKKLLRLQPDGLLVRNLASLKICQEAAIPAIADFSLNVANQLTADFIREQGAARVTVSYDLNRDQLGDLISATPASWLELVIHQHMPMFHMEHCVFCAAISPGTNKTNCGRPCDRHQVHLQDRIGMAHPLQADVGCRNTLYNAVPQSGAEVVPEMIAAGVLAYRVELLENDARSTRRIIGLYQQLLQGKVEPREVWQALQAANHVGVTRGTLEQRRNPLAII